MVVYSKSSWVGPGHSHSALLSPQSPHAASGWPLSSVPQSEANETRFHAFRVDFRVELDRGLCVPGLLFWVFIEVFTVVCRQVLCF